MIITRLDASNLLKYRQLSLNLPERGLIAISGQNESGKSSIGEAVCFALFGRTFSIGPDDLQKVVRWGENHCSVTLHFKVGEQRYELSRFLDRDGNHSAKLALAGQEEPLVRGVAKVDEKLIELLGFEFEQFVESFYLAQREITTPHPHSQAVKIMAGVAPLEDVVAEIEGEIEERKDLLEEVQEECDELLREMDRLGFQEGHLRQLQDERYETQDQGDQVAGLAAEIEERLDAYAQNTHAGYRAESARSRAGFLRFVFFILAAAAGAAWWLLGQGSGTPLAGDFRGLLEEYLPQWRQVRVEWLLWATIGFSALFLLMWVRVASKKAAVRRARAKAGQLADSLQRARMLEIDIEEPDAGELGQAEDDPPAEDEAAPYASEEEAPEAPPVRPDSVELEGLVEHIAAGEATVRRVREYVEPELQWLSYVHELLVSQAADLDEAIAEEQDRAKEQQNLLAIQNGIRSKRDEVMARIDLRRKALELLHAAISHLSNNFNRDIKDLVAGMLPRFTDRRYEHLQIDQDLKVRVFSAQKRDFMELEEVSSGTQRQIMLALRLALSQKLLSRKIKGQQFAFLDEPFAFFDEERTRNALIALADLGADISQVWIVAQTFPEDAEIRFDAHIACERGREELALN